MVTYFNKEYKTFIYEKYFKGKGDAMSTKTANLGPDAEIVENAAGGKQSKVSHAFHLLDPCALMALAEVTQYGAERYARDNWRLIEEEDHLNHAMIHLYAYMAKDEQDDHLEHAFCRLMFALAKKLRPDFYGDAEGKHDKAQEEVKCNCDRKEKG